MLTGTAGKRTFIHHDDVFTFTKCSPGHVFIARNVYGQRRFRGIAVRIRDGIGKVFRIGLAIRHVHVVVQLVGIGAVRVQRQLAELPAHGLAGLAAVDRGHRLVGRSIRAEHIIAQYVGAAAALLRRSFRQRNAVRTGRGHVVHDGHGNGAGSRSVVGIRHGHDKIMGDLRVRGVGIVLRGAVGQLVGELQLTRDGVKARHGQNAFVRRNGVAGKRTVFKHGHVVDDDGRHAVGRVDGQRTGCRSGLVPGFGTAFKTGFVHRHLVGLRARIGRRHRHTVVHTVDGDGHLALGHVAVGVGVGVGELFRQRLTVRQLLHFSVVVVESVAVGAVGIQRNAAVFAALVRIPGEGRIGVRTGHRAFQGVAHNRSGVTFLHTVREALDGRLVVHDIDGNGAARSGAVHVRHGDGKIVRYLRIRSCNAMLLRAVVKHIGILQFTRDGVEARHGQNAFVRRNGVAGKRTVFKHGHVVDDDGRHAVGRVDGQRTGCRSGLVPGFGTAFKTGFVHRHLVGLRARIGRRHRHTVVHTVDGDGHLALGHVAVGVSVSVSKLFRQRLTVRQLLHFGVVVVKSIAVGAVGIQRNTAVLALLLRIRPRKICSVCAGRRAFQCVAHNRRCVAFVHGMHETFDGRHVVGNNHGHDAGPRGAVVIRHGDGKIMSYLVRAFTAVFLRGLRKMIGVIQTSGGRIEARHFQIAFIRGNDLPRKSGAVEHHDAADDDGRNTVESIHRHVAGSRDGRAAAKTGFVHAEHAASGGGIGIPVVRVVGIVYHRSVVIKLTGIAGRDIDGIVDIAVARGRAVGVGVHAAAGPADVKAAKTIQAVQQIGGHIIMEAVAVALRPCGPSGTGGRHEVGLVHGHEEIFTRDFRALDLKDGHIVLGEGRIEIFQQNGAAVLKGHDHVVPGTGQRGGIGGKIKDEAALRFADYGLRRTGGRLHKMYIGHDNLLKEEENEGIEGEKCLTRKSPASAQRPKRGTVQTSGKKEEKDAKADETRAKNIKNPATSISLLT